MSYDQIVISMLVISGFVSGNLVKGLKIIIV